MRIGIDASRAFDNQKTGTETYSYQIIKHLLALPEISKHEVILYVKVSPSSVPPLNLRGGKSGGVIFKQISMSYLWTQIGLAYQTWVDKLDVLWVPAHTLPILARPGLAKVVTIHGIEYEWLPAYENWLQRWYLPLSTQYAVRSAQKIIAVSDFTKQQLIKRLGAEANKISVVHEGINYQDPKRSSNVLDRYNLKKQQYLLFIGTIQPRKNLKRLIEAFILLKLRSKIYHLVIAGKLGWSYQDVLDAADKNVVITGFVSDEDRNILLKNALVYVQPSITEGFGLPVLEAMAAGVPVVSSSGGALAEVVGDAGLLFGPLDVNDICHKLSLVIRSHTLQTALIKKGKERIKEFSWEKAARETYKILTKFEI